MQAILIDTFKQEITEIEWDRDALSIAQILHCQWITCAYPSGMERDVIYVDDEGLYVDDQRFFMISDYQHPLAGYGLVLGTDEVGDAVPPKSNIDELAKRIFFVDVT